MIKLTCPRHEELFIPNKLLTHVQESKFEYRCPFCQAKSIVCEIPDFAQPRTKKLNYLNWINFRFPTRLSAYCQCHQAVQEMKITFPELKIYRGLYNLEEHWWLQDKDDIVDPTIIQFNNPNGWYIILKDGTPEPLGTCYCCGAYVWDKKHEGMCSADCLVDIKQEYHIS